MTQINLWAVHAASVLAVSVLCSCTSTYVPDQSSTQPTYSVEQARNLVLGEAVPPVYFFDRRDDSIALNKPMYMISKIYIRATSMRVVTGYKEYNISLKNIAPSIFRDDSDGHDYVDIYITGNLQGFMADLLSLNAAGYRAGLYDGPFERERPKHFADALLVLKLAAVKFAEDDEARFQEAARNYRASAAKPQLTEGARRFEVQAEGAIRDKDFEAAVNYYGQALDLAPWWPKGHFNRALVLSEVDDFPDAIGEMKRYLALVPDAPNARAAQDKIYDWERKTQ
jgi:tetratricopeptide (TPR) repeat protein